jgi:hypothetical protein
MIGGARACNDDLIKAGAVVLTVAVRKKRD